MAIIKATYTKQAKAAKEGVRYIEHRPGKEGEKMTRTLFGSEGQMSRKEAYQMIDEAKKGSIFFRFVISPDPTREDTEKDLHLRDITAQTMQTLEERLKKPVVWVAAEHNDHAPHRHVHIVAVVPGRLYIPDFQALRKTATEAALEQRREHDRLQELQQERESREEGAVQWERQR